MLLHDDQSRQLKTLEELYKDDIAYATVCILTNLSLVGSSQLSSSKSACCTYGLIWFHLCLFIFRKIYKPLDLLVFQLLVKVGSFVAWPGFCTYEKTAIAAEYSKLLGLEEVEAFLTAGATTYLRVHCAVYMYSRFFHCPWFNTVETQIISAFL